MHWKIKASIQKLLSSIRYGDQINHWSSLLNNSYYSNGVIYHFNEFFRKFNLQNDFHKNSYKNRNALEIGTGYFLIEPIILSLLGFNEIYTVDVTKDIHFSGVKKTCKFLFTPEYIERIKEASALTSIQIDNQIDKINNSASLEEILEISRIKYFAPYTVEEVFFPGLKFDFIFSQVVLEHIDPLKLEELFKKFNQSISDDGMMVHTINFVDHFTNPGFFRDAAISEFNFLKFSDEDWDFWAGNNISYTNRLSFIYYYALAARSGFNVEIFQGENYKERKFFPVSLIHNDVLKKYSDDVDPSDLIKYQRGTFLFKKERRLSD